MTAVGGVPATVSDPRDAGHDRSLLVYSRSYALRLFPTPRRDGYTIASIYPLRLADHHRLAAGCLKLRPTQWETRFEIRQIPQGVDGYWPQILAKWAECVAADRSRLGASAVADRATRHTGFLDTLDRLIDATQEITTEAMTPGVVYPYREVTATGERRYGTHAVYEFRLAGDQAPEEGAFVQIRGEPGQRGQVTRVTEGTRVTVRFDERIDWARISQQGRLEVTSGSVVYDKQREAVAALRTGQTRNPVLLSVLVDHHVASIEPTRDKPSEELDEDQEAAFRKALGVQDMLLVVGPPGTGKTRVISQVARSCAFGAGKVLVASQSNRAVDNVLVRLPRDVLAIRVGNDGKVTAEGQPYLLERQASELRKQILNVTGRSLAAYENVGHTAGWADVLNDRDDELRAAIKHESEERDGLAAARRAAGGATQARIDRIAARLGEVEHELSRHRDRMNRLALAVERARARSGWPVFGALFDLLARRRENRVNAERVRGQTLRETCEQARDDLATAQQELDIITRDDPPVRVALASVEAAARYRAERRAAAVMAATAASEAVRGMQAPPLVRDQDAQTTEDGLAELRSWLAAVLPVLRQRAELLADWHDEVSGATDQLYPELIQYAGVIAATCTGAASRPEISGVDFDMAIVDEAGQVGVADVLVPLVRARRAVLVGDHRQLPPFLDSEVEQWGKVIGDQVTRDLMAKSALELLAGELPASHVTWLTRQRRMPAVIGDFVSASFYGGRLRTCVVREHRDPVFRRPLALVDTAGLPSGQRQEMSGRARERWGQPGYTNPAEASLLTSLAALYQGRGADWAVIVPYQAQARLIVSELTGIVADSALTGLNVGTVDSFQGGERDVILYGFTRSNPHGNIGFLAEVRRLNVAFTRARYQLVVIGDLGTLTSARDLRFRELIRSLRDHAAEHGEICSYAEARTRLTRLGIQA